MPTNKIIKNVKKNIIKYILLQRLKLICNKYKKIVYYYYV